MVSATPATPATACYTPTMLEDLTRIADALERIADALEQGRDSDTDVPEGTCTAPTPGRAAFELVSIEYVHRTPDVIPRGW